MTFSAPSLAAATVRPSLPVCLHGLPAPTPLEQDPEHPCPDLADLLASLQQAHTSAADALEDARWHLGLITHLTHQVDADLIAQAGAVMAAARHLEALASDLHTAAQHRYGTP